MRSERWKQWRLRPEQGGKFAASVDARIGLKSPGGLYLPARLVTEDNEWRFGEGGKFAGHKLGDQVVLSQGSDGIIYTVAALVAFGEPPPAFSMDKTGLATEHRVWCRYKEFHRHSEQYVWATPKYWRRYIKV